MSASSNIPDPESKSVRPGVVFSPPIDVKEVLSCLLEDDVIDWTRCDGIEIENPDGSVVTLTREEAREVLLVGRSRSHGSPYSTEANS
jgi:hypothetical protein